MTLRQMSDGHVMTLRSVEGHVIRLSVRDGQLVLSLSEPVLFGSGSGLTPLSDGEEREVVGPVLDEGEFIPVVSSWSYVY